jgi:hypothetical protein
MQCPECSSEMVRGRFWFIPSRWQRLVFCTECGYEELTNSVNPYESLAWEFVYLDIILVAILVIVLVVK